MPEKKKVNIRNLLENFWVAKAAAEWKRKNK